MWLSSIFFLFVLVKIKFFSSYEVLHLFPTRALYEFVPPFYRCVFNFVHLLAFVSRYGLTFSRFFGFTRLSKKQLSLTSSLSLPLSLRCHSRSWDEILS